MTLGLSQKYPWGEPTHFVEKIWAGLDHSLWNVEGYKSQGILDTAHFSLNNFTPKVTTIREDKKDRWKVGNKIHFVINNRTKDRLQIASVVKVTSIQHILIHHEENETISVWIDFLLIGIYSPEEDLMWNSPVKNYSLADIAQNDGFSSISEFFRWFDKDFTGKIIHWTDLKY